MIAAPPAQARRAGGVRRPPPACPSGVPDVNAIALELIGRDYLSYSAMSAYQKCALRFYFQYVAALAPAFTPAPLVFGGAIHKAVEGHYRTILETSSPPPLDDLLVAYDAAWKAESKAPVRFGKGESQNSLRDLAARMLWAFQASEVSKLDTSLLAVEEEFRAPLIPGCPDILGRLDLLVLDAYSLRIVDFKTSRSVWGQAKIVEAAPQQLLYTELVRPLAKKLGNRPIEVEWVVITKTKKPTVQRYRLTPDPVSIARVKAMVQHVWRAIAAGHFYPCPSSMNCPTCPYASACRVWEG